VLWVKGGEPAVNERVKIICPNCDNVIAVAPDQGLPEPDLVCSNCGARLRGSGPLEQASDKLKEVVKEAEKKIQDRV